MVSDLEMHLSQFLAYNCHCTMMGNVICSMIMLKHLDTLKACLIHICTNYDNSQMCNSQGGKHVFHLGKYNTELFQHDPDMQSS
jgi:hypothetical protein